MAPALAPASLLSVPLPDAQSNDATNGHDAPIGDLATSNVQITSDRSIAFGCFGEIREGTFLDPRGNSEDKAGIKVALKWTRVVTNDDDKDNSGAADPLDFCGRISAAQGGLPLQASEASIPFVVLWFVDGEQRPRTRPRAHGRLFPVQRRRGLA